MSLDENDHAVDSETCLFSSDNEEYPSLHISSFSKDNHRVPLVVLKDVLDVNQLHELIRELRLKLEKKHGKELVLRHKIKTLKEEHVATETRITQLTQYKCCLDQEVANLTNQVQSLQYELNIMQDKRKNAELLLKKIQEQLEKKEKSHGGEVDLRQRLQMRVEELEAKVDRLNSQLIETEKSEKQQMEEKQKLQFQLDEGQMQLETVQRQLATKETRHLEQMQEKQKLEAAIGQLKAERSQLYCDCQDLQIKNEELQLMVNSLETQNKVQQGEVAERDAKLQAVVDSVELGGAEKQKFCERIEAEKQQYLVRVTAEMTDEVEKKTNSTLLKMSMLQNEHELEKASWEKEKETLEINVRQLKENLDTAARHAEDSSNTLSCFHSTYSAQIEDLQNTVKNLNESEKQERDARFTSEERAAAARSELAAVTIELNHKSKALTEAEQQISKLQEDLARLHDKKQQDILDAAQTNQELLQQLTSANSRLAQLEKEVQSTRFQLESENFQHKQIKAEHERLLATDRQMENGMKREREMLNKTVESLQGKIFSLEQEADKYQTQLQENQNFQKKLSLTMESLQYDHSQYKIEMDDQNKSLNITLGNLREELRSVQLRYTSLEQEHQQLQTELYEMTQKYANQTTVLEIKTETIKNLEIECDNLNKTQAVLSGEITMKDTEELARIHQIKELEEQLLRVQSQLEQATCSLEEREKQHETEESEGKEQQMKVNEKMLEMEAEQTKLEETQKNLRKQVEKLQLQLEHEIKVKDSLSAEITDLKSTNKELQNSLDVEAAKKSMLQHEAEDSRLMWEAEVKTKGRLGTRLAQLEKLQDEAEKNLKMEHQKVADADREKKESETQLGLLRQQYKKIHSDFGRVSAQLKAAKRKLREKRLSKPEMQISSLSMEFNSQKAEMQDDITQLKGKIDDLIHKLEEEQRRNLDLEKQLKWQEQELSLARLQKKRLQQLEKETERSEEELAELRQELQELSTDRGQLERLKQEYQLMAKAELNAKLHQVNQYLDQQSQEQARLQSLRHKAEFQIREEFQKSKRTMEQEIDKLRVALKAKEEEGSSLQQQCQKLKELYDSELQMRERMSEKLGKLSSVKAQERQSSLLQLRLNRRDHVLPLLHREMASLEPRVPPPASPPSATSSSSSLYIPGAADCKPPLTDSPEDGFSYKVKQELDQSIKEHMESAPFIDISIPHRDTQSKTTTGTLNEAIEDATAKYLETLEKSYFIK